MMSTQRTVTIEELKSILDEKLEEKLSPLNSTIVDLSKKFS